MENYVVLKGHGFHFFLVMEKSWKIHIPQYTATEFVNRRL